MTWLVLAAALAAGPAPAAEDTGMSLPASFRPFDARSPWNQPIAADAAVDPNAAAMMARLAAVAGRLKGDTTQWTIPMFVVDAATLPGVRADFTKDSNPLIDPEGKGYAEGLPIPPGAWPDPKPDGHMLLVDPKRMRSWDFSRARRLGDGRWQASRIDTWDLAGMGRREPFTGRNWWTLGARGSGFPLIAGLIRPEEIAAGVIEHALVFAAPTNRLSLLPNGPKELCPPASRTDGTHHGPDSLPMGVRLQLDPALDLDRLGLSPAARVIARAMQVYGLYNGDSTHDVFKIYFQNLGPDGGAWAGMGLDSLSRIPIEAFRVLRCEVAYKR